MTKGSIVTSSRKLRAHNFKISMKPVQWPEVGWDPHTHRPSQWCRSPNITSPPKAYAASPSNTTNWKPLCSNMCVSGKHSHLSYYGNKNKSVSMSICCFDFCISMQTLVIFNVKVVTDIKQENANSLPVMVTHQIFWVISVWYKLVCNAIL